MGTTQRETLGLNYSLYVALLMPSHGGWIYSRNNNGRDNITSIYPSAWRLSILYQRARYQRTTTLRDHWLLNFTI